MKRLIQIVCILLVASMVLAIPVSAAEQASNFFGSHSCYLWKISDTEFQVWFNVVALDGMDVLGASEIKVQCSTDATNWETVATHTNLFGYNTGTYGSHVTYSSAQSGYYYRAIVTFYAENDTGIGKYTDATSHLAY